MNHSNYSTQEIEQIKNRTEKKCTVCHVEKNKNYFGKKTSAIDGRTAMCLECQREKQGMIRAERRLTAFS